ncbi:MAG: carboxypeptidase-like regulatory domain-containing protein [Polaribacter sp.]|nr:carboxypeptidase-like regulatory domain-containing protein [Polaribacter sp.]
MKKIFLLFFLVSVVSSAQVIVKGRVLSFGGKILEGASVYLNNTTIGVYTDEEGNFELALKEGTYDLIVSFIGYKTTQHLLNTTKNTKPLLFKLLPETTVLDELVLKKTTYDNQWKHNLSRFKQALLGRTILSKNCKILNPKVLHFEFDSTTGTLTAEIKEPLKIEHKGLGFLITYDLVDFSLGREQLIYLGYTKYENLSGGKRKQKRWKQNRLKAFNGSRMHFVRSLRNQNLKEEGFLVNQFKRVLNADRPSEEAIKKARQLIHLNRNSVVFEKKRTNPKTPLDSAMVILKKSRLPKYRDFLYKKNVPYSDMILISKKNILIKFKDYLSIIYTKEPEEKNYMQNNFLNRRKALDTQTSAITMLTKTAILDPSGDIINPLDIFSEGYWSYEQFADLLPLDYNPPKKK